MMPVSLTQHWAPKLASKSFKDMSLLDIRIIVTFFSLILKWCWLKRNCLYVGWRKKKERISINYLMLAADLKHKLFLGHSVCPWLIDWEGTRSKEKNIQIFFLFRKYFIGLNVLSLNKNWVHTCMSSHEMTQYCNLILVL